MTRFDFLLKTFATHTEQMRAMLDNQQTIVDMLNEPREAERFKRPWVGLTDGEVQECIRSADRMSEEYKRTSYWANLAVAIEARLKEKNT
jgi:hypothetical protein